jgi:hypothetical protein
LEFEIIGLPYIKFLVYTEFQFIQDSV